MANNGILLHSYNSFQTNANKPNDSRITDISIAGNIGGYNRQSSNYLRGNIYNKADLVKAVISRIALDASMVDFKHFKLNITTGDQTSIKSGLIDCLTVDANIDQTGRNFIYDTIWSMLDEGIIASVPIDTTAVPNEAGAYEINSIRVGRIMQWYPQQVRVRCYDERDGLEKDLVMSKRTAAIIESPLLTVLNENNGTLKMLQNKLKIMLAQDANAAAGKLNGFLQVPYSTKNNIKKERALQRQADLESEMSTSRYGLATLDANERYIPAGNGLNNNLLDDIRKLQQDFYNQTGITENVMNGTANEEEMNVYYYRTIDPILQALVDSWNRTFITKTARSQGQIIQYYRDPFKGIPVDKMATAADLFTRNAIFTPNEIRRFLGKPPHPDPLANTLYNRNIADGNQGVSVPGQPPAGQMGIKDDGKVDPLHPPRVESPYGNGILRENQKNGRAIDYSNTHNPDGSKME